MHAGKRNSRVTASLGHDFIKDPGTQRQKQPQREEQKSFNAGKLIL